jgi:hypothetical protein
VRGITKFKLCSTPSHTYYSGEALALELHLPPRRKQNLVGVLYGGKEVRWIIDPFCANFGLDKKFR